MNITQGDRIRIFENKGVRGIFGHKGEDVRGEWRMLLNGEACKFQRSVNILNFN